MSKKSSTSYTPAATFHEVRAEKSSILCILIRQTGTALAVLLALGRIATPRPPPLRVRPWSLRHVQGGRTRPLRPTEPLAHKRLRLVTTLSKQLALSDEGMAQRPLAPPRAKQPCGPRHHHSQAMLRRLWHGPSWC